MARLTAKKAFTRAAEILGEHADRIREEKKHLQRRGQWFRAEDCDVRAEDADRYAAEMKALASACK
jgi:hypothetical protein